jgi:glycosyltransferase involved in cell wall biosynthesis
VPPLVSIVIPTYNRAELVGEAIESALRQTYSACEIIVVDDGSTDETPTVLSRYGSAIQTARTANRGCAAARNTGIGLARGPYLAFVDSDDTAPPDKLALQAPILDRHPEVGFVYGQSLAFGAELACEQRLVPILPDADGSVAAGLFLTTRIGFDSVLVRREAVERAGGFDESLLYNEDTDLLLRVALDWKAVCLDVPTGRHRWHAGRKSRDTVALWRAVLRSSERVLERRPDFAARLGRQAPARLSAIRREILEALVRRHELADARELARCAWRHSPSAGLALWYLLLRIPPLGPTGLAARDALARAAGFLRARLRWR